MNHDLIAISYSVRVEACLEGAFDEELQGVGTPLFGGDVGPPSLVGTGGSRPT